MRTIINMPKKVENAIKTVVIARAKWQTINEIDHETKLEILRNNEFYEDESKKRITTINADFLMSTEDFETYCHMVYAKNCEKGIDSGAWDLNFWPIQKAVYDSEDKLIDAIASDVPEYTPDIIKSVKTSPKNRTKFFQILGL